MPTNPRSRIETLFLKACERPPEERIAFLRNHCDDPSVRADVRSLLAVRADAPDFFQDLGADVVAPMAEALGSEPADPDDAAGTPDLTGQRIGPYRLTEEIGVGGMSVVYRAERTDGDFEQTVAVKLLQRRLHSGDAEQRFRAERQVLASLDHPNIARLYDGGVTEGGRPYFVMEHVDGTPLTDYADANDLSLQKRLDLLDQVLEAVQAAHGQLVVHRDLKPSNVLVTETESGPTVKLLDFGIAKLMDDSMPVTAPQTETGHHLMTPSYAAPEQVTAADVTTHTDVYQLGVLAYELLAGTRPFDLSGKSLTEIERIVVEEAPPAPSEQAEVNARSLRGDMDTILQKALRKEPERRYRSVEALAADLARHRAGEPIAARPATLRYRTKKFVRRNWWGVGVAVSFLAIIAVAGTMLVRQRNRAQRNAERAQQEAETAEEVSEYLTSLFEEADPNLTRADTVTARELLRQGMDRIDELDSQPAVQAELLHVLGRTRRRMGLLDSTRALLERSLQLKRQIHERPHFDIAKTLNQIATVARDNGNYAEAESLYTDAIAMSKAVRGPKDSLVAMGYKNLVYVRRQLGNLDEAEAAVRKALSIQRAEQGERSMAVAESLYNLAAILKDRGEYDKAERVQRRSLELCKELTDGSHPGTASNYNNLALLLEHQGNYAEAKEMYLRALDMWRALYGNVHPQAAATLLNVGVSLNIQEKPEKAEKYLREALRIRRALHGDSHPEIALVLKTLGDVFRDQRRLATADSMFRAAATMYREAGMEKSPDMAHVLESLGDNLRIQDRYAAAERKYQTALEIRKSIYDPDHPDVDRVRSLLAALYEEWGRPEKAEKYRSARDTQAQETRE